MKRQTFQAGVLREQWDTDTRLFTAWNGAGQQTQQRAFTPAENAQADVEVLAAAGEANVSQRQAKIATAKARMQQIVVLATSPGARGATAWTQPQRIQVLDAIQDMARALSWLADQEMNVTDTPEV